MLYELRHYDARDGRSLDALNRQMEADVLPAWQRHGVQPVGFWSVIIGAPLFRLTYLLRWDDLAQRQTRWNSFTSDPVWRQAAPNGEIGEELTCSADSVILEPTFFSPLPRHDDQPQRLTGGVFELHTYVFDTAHKLAQTLAWFGESGKAHLDKHSMFAMGFWTTYIGASPRLTFMLVFENLAHRESAWAGFYTDPAWSTVQDGLYSDGQPLVARAECCAMKGTELFGWR